MIALMTRLMTSLDIANRALDHCGQDALGPQGFFEQSKKARLVSRLYDNLRRAELRRKVFPFATKRSVMRPFAPGVMLASPVLWSPTQTYFIGSVVTDAFGIAWTSNVPDNINQEPGVSFAWDFYSGPLNAFPWDSTQSYYPGELVYLAPGDGTYTVYRSRVPFNKDNPATPTPWTATATYNKNDIVLAPNGAAPEVLYISLVNLNIGQQPNQTSPAPWNSGVTYSIGQKVRGGDGLTYVSAINSNQGHNPLLDPLGAIWTNTHVMAAWDSGFDQTASSTGSNNWLQVPAQLTKWDPFYPIGSGPSTQSTTKNLFQLPANFLREAPQDPRAGSTSYLGAFWGLAYPDNMYENGFIVSPQVDPSIYVFVSDYGGPFLDPMFAEGLALRVALEACEPLTQSADKAKVIASKLEKFMGEARTVAGIEQGPVEPPVDDYLACRG